MSRKLVSTTRPFRAVGCGVVVTADALRGAIADG
jgi:hypothetical protein